MSAETRQTSGLETTQMFSTQMSTGQTGRCPVSLLYICLVSAEDVCVVPKADISPVSEISIVQTPQY